MNNKCAEHVRVNHKLTTDDDGDECEHYVWFYRDENRWLVQFGYDGNRRKISRYYDDITALLQEYPIDALS